MAIQRKSFAYSLAKDFVCIVKEYFLCKQKMLGNCEEVLCNATPSRKRIPRGPDLLSAPSQRHFSRSDELAHVFRSPQQRWWYNEETRLPSPWRACWGRGAAVYSSPSWLHYPPHPAGDARSPAAYFARLVKHNSYLYPKSIRKKTRA